MRVAIGAGSPSEKTLVPPSENACPQVSRYAAPALTTTAATPARLVPTSSPTRMGAPGAIR